MCKLSQDRDNVLYFVTSALRFWRTRLRDFRKGKCWPADIKDQCVLSFVSYYWKCQNSHVVLLFNHSPTMGSSWTWKALMFLNRSIVWAFHLVHEKWKKYILLYHEKLYLLWVAKLNVWQPLFLMAHCSRCLYFPVVSGLKLGSWSLAHSSQGEGDGELASK